MGWPTNRNWTERGDGRLWLMSESVTAFLRKWSKSTRKLGIISVSEVQTMSKFWSKTTWSVFSFTLHHISAVKRCDVEYNPVCCNSNRTVSSTSRHGFRHKPKWSSPIVKLAISTEMYDLCFLASKHLQLLRGKFSCFIVKCFLFNTNQTH
jgi:tRNA(Ile2) C34 agmatinyltransferase TiaS